MRKRLIILRSAAAQAPGDFSLAAQIVRDTAASGDHEKALAAATALVKQYHGDDPSLSLLKEIAGNLPQTTKIVRDLVKQDQSNPTLYGALSDLLGQRAGHDAESNETLATALSRWPDDLRLIRRRVARLRASGELSTAAKLLAEQIAKSPTDDLELQAIFDPLARPSAHGRLRAADMRADSWVSANATAAKLCCW